MDTTDFMTGTWFFVSVDTRWLEELRRLRLEDEGVLGRCCGSQSRPGVLISSSSGLLGRRGGVLSLVGTWRGAGFLSLVEIWRGLVVLSLAETWRGVVVWSLVETWR